MPLSHPGSLSPPRSSCGEDLLADKSQRLEKDPGGLGKLAINHVQIALWGRYFNTLVLRHAHTVSYQPINLETKDLRCLIKNFLPPLSFNLRAMEDNLGFGLVAISWIKIKHFSILLHALGIIPDIRPIQEI